MILEDFNGESLKNLIGLKRIQLEQFLRIAVWLSETGVINKKSQYKTVQDLGEAVTKELILPSNENYEYIHVAGEEYIRDFPFV